MNLSTNLSSIPASTIADKLREGEGYHIIENAVPQATIDELLSLISAQEYLVNNNEVGVVYASRMRFHSHTLAASKSCYDLVTDETIRAISRSFFDGPHKVSNQRLYETHTQAHVPWHTDNNLQEGVTFKGKHSLPGILFLLYLSDVANINPFQLIPGSHKWSAEHNERFFSDHYIHTIHGRNIVSVQAPRGTLIMCNSHLIHRAEPFAHPGYRRFTFLFQVDALSNEYVGHGEKLLINPSFVNDTSPAILNYLGFGIPATYQAFPQTSISTMLPSDLWALQRNIIPKMIFGLLLHTIKQVLPGGILNKLKNLKRL
ncbi:phytanoyl-CoA dioxygenase family protein [Hymenobacter arizonensis]|uniref:Phytanoyl-CoA dioxygenase (PhyH) n=1 Tax=Hymenobacter arizonensis TaxID=1227077 RepID=A0A1I6BQ21_HYMAR|nr:phytanoyl-CoA dioxygenase family protein [Hymenobacter arizonensis]SFQ83042.1 Phytanoyl-CoA dioxygenase (PhyH) [Hymenobacter arizonensis]